MNRKERRRLKKTLGKKLPVAGSDIERRNRNLAAFQQFLPGLHKVLVGHSPRSELVYDEAGKPDIVFQGSRLYGETGARGYARRQLDDYWRSPRRLSRSLFDAGVLDDKARTFTSGLTSAADDKGITFSTGIDAERSYFAVSLGIGLGLHIDEFVQRTECQCLIFADTNLDGIYHSLAVFDWVPVLRRFSGNRRLDFVISDSPEDISTFIRKTILTINPCGIEGMHIFTQTPNRNFKEAAAHFSSHPESIIARRLGFFDDEFHMILFTYENLKSGTSRVISDSYGTTECPIFIVGAGPSLDDCIDVIKKYQDMAVIISCGSAVDPLFAHGIVADFLVIIEPDPYLLPYHEYTQEEHDLSKVCLVAASNIYPPLTDYHDNCIYFFRPGGVPRAIFANSYESILFESEPVVANTAFAFAHRAGFRDVYLFGIDMGAKDPRHHHSVDSVYTTKGLYYPEKFSVPVKGANVETVFTTETMLKSLRIMEAHITKYGNESTIYNCSDGALIEGTITTDPSTLSLSRKPNKHEVVSRVFEESPTYTSHTFERSWKRADMADSINRFCDRTLALARKHDILNPEFMTAIFKHLDINADENAVAMLFRGSFYCCLSAIAYLESRVSSRARRTEFRDLAYAAFAKTVDNMRNEALDMIAALGAGKGPELVADRWPEEPVPGVPVPTAEAWNRAGHSRQTGDPDPHR